MRWRTSEQHEAYPRITSYLQDLPMYLSENPRVFDAFQGRSGLNGAEARRVATLGQFPLFRVAPITIGGQRVGANGSHSNGLVTLDLDIASEIESPVHLSEGHCRVLLYATALHELVHFGRWQNNLSVTINGNEAGKMFECSAYQGDVGWSGSSSHLSQSRNGRYNNVRWSCPLSTLTPGRVQLTWTPSGT